MSISLMSAVWLALVRLISGLGLALNRRLVTKNSIVELYTPILWTIEKALRIASAG